MASLYLNTDGSSYDTVMAVFKRSVTGALQQTACDNNSGLDHLDSSLSVSVKAGVTNFIVIDGVNSATGNLKLNYSLCDAGLPHPARLHLAERADRPLQPGGRARSFPFSARRRCRPGPRWSRPTRPMAS
jgi:hypothetical protein